MAGALLAQTLTFTLKFGGLAALGLLLLGAGLGYVLAPGLRAKEERRLSMFVLNLAVALTSLALDTRTLNTLCLVTSAVVVMMLWDQEGPHLKKRLLDGWHKATSRLTRPVISLPS